MKLLTTLVLSLMVSTQTGGEPTIEQLILQAGNADRDEDRLAILENLSRHDEISESLRGDLETLIKVIHQYIENPRIDYFGSRIHKTGEYNLGVPKDSPLYYIALFYEARMLSWVTMEYGDWWNHFDKRRERFDLIRSMFEQVRDTYPGNRICRMYLGEPLPCDKNYISDPAAPDWANYQRVALERLTDIITWWINNRMRENGEFGGGWGDDCEMWRWWIPILIGFDDPIITTAQARFSRALLSQPHMVGGYTRIMYDVEHTSEDSSDALMPMLHLEPDNPEWSKAAFHLAELMRDVWCGVNDLGHFQFKSTYFNVERVNDDPWKACDTVYHTRAVEPALLLWQRTADPALGSLFTRWMDTWVDAASRSERGKPAGVIPSAIHWPDGNIGGLGLQWWDPENHTDDPLYVWPSAMGHMMDTLLLTHFMTQNPKYLEPLLSMARVRLDFIRQPQTEPIVPGSRAWCGQFGRTRDIAGKYKLVLGGDEFDDLIANEAGTYVKARLDGDYSELTNSLGRTAQALSINFPGYTSEVRYTDRVLRFPQIFQQNGMYSNPSVDIPIPQYDILYSMMTGDPGDGMVFPTNAVRWLTSPREIAALVTQSGKHQFEAEVFHFGEEARNLDAEFYLLVPGDYQLEVSTGGEAYGKTLFFSVVSPRTRISLSLPPRLLCKVRVTGRKNG